jgi:hypothetical protein
VSPQSENVRIVQSDERRNSTSKRGRETEAEAVAFVVCHAIGLETGSASQDYIQLYEGDAKLLTNVSTQQAQGLGAKLFKLIAGGAKAVVCMHHRKKDVGDTTPTLENTLRGTGDFGAMADCVWSVEHARRKKESGSG